MKIKDLKDYKLLKKDIAYLDKQIHKLKKQVITQDIVSASASSPSFSKTTVTITGADVYISKKIQLLTLQRDTAYKKLLQIEEYLQNIDDSLVRLGIRHKYINGSDWQEAAQKIGGGNTADSVRMAVHRYLSSNN